jgi:predicted transcriptional regulator
MKKGTLIGYCNISLLLRNGLFCLTRYKHVKNKKVVQKNRSTFHIVAEIVRELLELTGVTNIISNCSMSFKQSRYHLSFMKSSDLIQTYAITARARVKYCRTEARQKFLETYDKMILLLDPGFFPRCPMQQLARAAKYSWLV